MSSDSPSRRACDRCHNIKERCQWLHHADICQRCLRLNHDCQTRRPIQKLGRKPRHPAAAQSETPGTSTIALVTPGTTASTSSPSSVCEKSPAKSESTVSYLSPPEQNLNLDDSIRLLDSLVGLDDAERELVNVCLRNPEICSQFTLGPTFHLVHQRDLICRLRGATAQLKEAFVAIGGFMAQAQNLTLSTKGAELCTSKAAIGVANLRRLHVGSREDVTTALFLGFLACTYSLFCSDGQARHVCSTALSYIEPWYRWSGTTFENDEYAVIITLIYSELILCVMNSELPTIRYGDHGKFVTTVDRYMGLAPTFLAFFYDISALSYALRLRQKNLLDESVLRRLEEIERDVKMWKPMSTQTFPNHYTHVEVVQMLAQIKSMRQAALLVLHRLQHPYGTHDDKGMALADSILSECSLAMEWISTLPMGMDLAFLIGCCEAQKEQQEQTLQSVERALKFSAEVQDRTRAMLKALWVAKSMSVVHWFDIPTHLGSTTNNVLDVTNSP
jgi:hypothetical protein